MKGEGLVPCIFSLPIPLRASIQMSALARGGREKPTNIFVPRHVAQDFCRTPGLFGIHVAPPHDGLHAMQQRQAPDTTRAPLSAAHLGSRSNCWWGPHQPPRSLRILMKVKSAPSFIKRLGFPLARHRPRAHGSLPCWISPWAPLGTRSSQRTTAVARGRIRAWAA